MGSRWKIEATKEINQTSEGSSSSISFATGPLDAGRGNGVLFKDCK